MFQQKSAEGFCTPLDKVERKTLVHGEKTLMVEFRLQPGGVIPMHSHPHEQAGYLVSGRIELTIGNQLYTAAPGDSWCIAGDLEHGVRTLEESVIVELFAPVREDYLP
jgi:quercetin dioxygenase-like cupin family protein